MKCEHCGKSISFLSYFCEYCGQPVQPFGKRVSAFCQTALRTFKNICKKNKWLLPAILAVVVVLIAVPAVMNRQRSLNFAKYVSFEVEGYDGFGELEVKIDYDKLTEDVLGKEPDKESKSQYEKYVQYNEDKKRLKNLIFFNADRTYDLQNGDFFLITVWVAEDELFEENKIKIEEDGLYTRTYEIGKDTEMLAELQKINFFDYVRMEFRGSNGDGEPVISSNIFSVFVSVPDFGSHTLNFQYCESDWGTSYFTVTSSDSTDDVQIIYVYVEYDNGLSNGDTVKVVLEIPEEELVEQYGIRFVESEKEYIVSNLS